MDLGVTMGISLRFKAAQPYLWRGGGVGKEEEEFRRQWPKDNHKKRSWPRGDAVPAGLFKAGLGRWMGAGLR